VLVEYLDADPPSGSAPLVALNEALDEIKQARPAINRDIVRLRSAPSQPPSSAAGTG